MNKARQKIWDKSGGLCWYCGNALPEKGWHADHFKPIRRNWTDGTCMHPDRDKEENKVPTCASCNVQKGSLTLEHFRDKITGFINSLNLYHTQYMVAKRYGLITETQQSVKFWFETNPQKGESHE